MPSFNKWESSARATSCTLDAMWLVGVMLACFAAACSYAPTRILIGDDDPPAGDGPAEPDPDDPVSDLDNDGVPDAEDLCPTLASVPVPDARDHDGDLRGDACDRCPHISDPVDPDQDGDGIGDACDPRPTQPGDQLIHWYGFYDSEATEVMGWPDSGGSWVVANGMLSEIGTGTAFESKGPPGTIARPYIATSVRLDAINGTGTWTAAAAGGVTGTQFYECFTCAGNGCSFVEAQSNSGDNNTPRPQVPIGGVTDIVVQLDTQLTCRFVGDGLDETVTLSASTINPGRIHLSSQRSQVSFDYLFVVAIGP
jgi:hypothetical protein